MSFSEGTIPESDIAGNVARRAEARRLTGLVVDRLLPKPRCPAFLEILVLLLIVSEDI